MTETVRLNRDSLGRRMVEAHLADTKVAGIELVDRFFEVLRSEILAGNEVAIPDFGKFSTYVRQNGSKKPKFTPFGSFKSEINA